MGVHEDSMSAHVGDRLSQAVQTQLKAVRSAIRLYIALDGLLLAALLTMLIFWIGGAIDYFPVTVGSSETPQWVRATLLSAIIGLVAWITLWRAGRRLIANLPDSSLAVLLERRFPQLNNELVTAVELVGAVDRDASNPAAYGQMLARVHQAVSSRVGNLPARTLLNWQPIIKYAILTTMLAVVSVVAMIGIPDWMGLWSKRLFALSDDTWPRRSRLRADGIQLQLPAFTGQMSADRTLIVFENNVARVPRGAAPVLQISADTTAAEVPAICTLYYRDEFGSRGRANLRRVGGGESGWRQFSLDGPPLDGLTEDLRFDVIGNDARLSNFTIQAIEPAVVNSLVLDCTYAIYLLDDLSARATSEQLPYRNGLVIPEGTTVTVKGIASSALSQVQYVMLGSGVAQSTDGTTPALDIKTIHVTGTEFSIPLGQLRSGLVLELRLLDQFGLVAAQVSRYLINVAADNVPEVQSRLVGIGTAITPRANLPLKGSVRDDHGLLKVWADLVQPDRSPESIELAVNLDNQLDSALDLQKIAEQRSLKLEPETTLGIVVSAQDRFNLDNATHVSAGPAQQLAIVTDDKLLVILDRQELELRQRLELTIGELTQLRVALQDIAKIDIASSPNTEPADSSDVDAPADPAEQSRRLVVVRTQQSVLQADKSQQELIGIAGRVEDIRLQLVNNRIDSLDRQTRLQKRVYEPLKEALDKEVSQLGLRLNELQSAAMAATEKNLDIASATTALDKLIVVLEQIIANMLDIESYNEIIDLVRGLLETEERLLDETQKQQKQQIFDLLR